MSFTKNELIEQLELLQVPVGSIVLMHTSLRAIGQVEGGTGALLDALVEHFTREKGLFCVPTHTWHNMGKSVVLKMDDPDTCLGGFSVAALKDGRGIRTENPTHSMVVFGDPERAAAFIKDDCTVQTPTAPESCYGKLFTEGGYVLLAGVAQNRNTYLHTVDEILQVPNRMETESTPMTVEKSSGERIRRDIRMFYTDYSEDISYRFPKYETAFRYHGCIRDGKLGNAPVQLCDARKMLETVALIHQNSGGIDPLRTEEPIPQRWYCTK